MDKANPTPQHDEDDALFRDVLLDVLAMAKDIAKTIHAEATKPQAPGSDPAPDLSEPFDRVARIIRRTIALARSLREPYRAPKPRAEGAIPGVTPDRTQARKRIIRRVEDRIRVNNDGEREESLREELYDRMDAPDLEDDIAARPVADIIEDLCNDLGVGYYPQQRRSPAEAAALAEAAAAIGPTRRPPPRPNHPIPDQAAQRRSDIELMHKILAQANNPARKPAPNG